MDAKGRPEVKQVASAVAASADVERSPAAGPQAVRWLRGRLRTVAGFLLKWLAASGFVATFSTCPFCGQQGCPGGAASAGVLGAVMAGVLTLFGIRRRGDVHGKATRGPASAMDNADTDGRMKA